MIFLWDFIRSNSWRKLRFRCKLCIRTNCFSQWFDLIILNFLANDGWKFLLKLVTWVDNILKEIFKKQRAFMKKTRAQKHYYNHRQHDRHSSQKYSFNYKVFSKSFAQDFIQYLIFTMSSLKDLYNSRWTRFLEDSPSNLTYFAVQRWQPRKRTINACACSHVSSYHREPNLKGEKRRDWFIFNCYFIFLFIFTYILLRRRIIAWSVSEKRLISSICLLQCLL